jgi:outer membrane protein OmpA-like peptidoglycan-associated protein
MLAYGKDMPPEELEYWNIPQEVRPVMEQARASLMAVLTPETIQARPEDAARAQFYFDCWVEQQEENWQIDDIAYCRDGLQTSLSNLNAPPVNLSAAASPEMEAHASMQKLESMASPVPSELRPLQEMPSSEEEAPQSPQAQAAPMPASPPVPTGTAQVGGPETLSYVVFFDYNSADLSASGATVVDEVARALSGMSDYEVVINGYTDTSGSPEYNLKLSNQRVDSVKQGLVERGVKDNAIKSFAFGKSDPKFNVGEGTREAANRRVEIFLN